MSKANGLGGGEDQGEWRGRLGALYAPPVAGDAVPYRAAAERF